MKTERNKNPIGSKKLWWLWVFLFPIALLLYAVFEAKEDGRIRSEKRLLKQEKKRKKQERLRKKQEAFIIDEDEFDFWLDDEGL